MKQIKGFNKYLIGVDGSLFSLKTMRFLTKIKDKDGYIVYRLFNDKKTYTKKAHRLVAEAYLDIIEGKNDVNHIDGIKNNNNLFNLEWVSKSENCKHAWKNKLNHKGGKLVIDLRTGIFYNTAKDAAIAKNISYDSLKPKLRGERFNNTSLKYI